MLIFKILLLFDLAQYKEYWIKECKQALKKYIKSNPLVSDCHGNKVATYTITEEKRNMFMSKYSSHEALVKAGLDHVMTWNSTDDICESWTDEECIELINAWNSIITPLVSYQQLTEKEIRAAKSIDEVKGISFDYSNADIRKSISTAI